MGGLSSEVSEATTEVLLECAYFAPASIRPTARRLKLHTRASLIASSAAPSNGLPAIADSCAALIVKLAGGYLSSRRPMYPLARCDAEADAATGANLRDLRTRYLDTQAPGKVS